VPSATTVVGNPARVIPHKGAATIKEDVGA
jgi:hypothetical protein